jgi:hypothetical protein
LLISDGHVRSLDPPSWEDVEAMVMDLVHHSAEMWWTPHEETKVFLKAPSHPDLLQSTRVARRLRRQ